MSDGDTDARTREQGADARSGNAAEQGAAEALTITGAQRAVDAYIGQFAAGYWPPLANLARLVEEVGELARALNHSHGHKPRKPEEPEQELALELADILFVVIAIANEQRIDLERAFRRVLSKYDHRDRDRWERLEG
jgi:NTP pyrophosphatase (non-canonical NTP hydrolase)